MKVTQEKPDFRKKNSHQEQKPETRVSLQKLTGVSTNSFVFDSLDQSFRVTDVTTATQNRGAP